MNGISPTIGIQPFNVIQDWGAQSSLSQMRRLSPYPKYSPFMQIARRSGCGPGPRPPSVPLDERIRLSGNHPGTPFDKSPFEEVSKRRNNLHPISMARLPMSMYRNLMESEENAAKAKANEEIVQAQLFIPNIYKKMEIHKAMLEEGLVLPGSEPDYTEAEKAYLAHIGTHDLDKIKQILTNMSNSLQQVQETIQPESGLETSTGTVNPAETGEDAEEEVTTGNAEDDVAASEEAVEEAEGDEGAEETKEEYIDEDDEKIAFRPLLNNDGSKYVLSKADLVKGQYSNKSNFSKRLSEILTIISDSVVTMTDKITNYTGRQVSLSQVNKELNNGNYLIVDKETGYIYVEPQGFGPGGDM